MRNRVPETDSDTAAVSSPVHADDHAVTQAAITREAAGSVKIENVRNHRSAGFQDVATSRPRNGIEKNRQSYQERIQPDAADARCPARRRHRFFRGQFECTNRRERWPAPIAQHDGRRGGCLTDIGPPRIRNPRRTYRADPTNIRGRHWSLPPTRS